MINKTILEQVKKLVFGEEPQTPVAPATPAEAVKMMVDVTLEDGTTILKVDKLEVGGIVTLNDMPAPDGEHKLADGKVIKTSGGVIVEVVPVVAELEQKAAPLVPEEMKQLPVQMAAHQASVKSLQAQNANLKEAVAQLLKFTEELNEKVEKFGEQSKVKPAEIPDGLTENYKQVLKNRGKI